MSGYSKKIIAIDFDGTIVKNKFPYIENPDTILIDFIREHRNDFIWILWTCRTGRQLRFAVDYMKKEHGIVFDYVNDNCREAIEKNRGCNSRKIFADYYIDDKNADYEKLLADVRGDAI